MKQRISGVDVGSIAYELGIMPGDTLIAINDEEIEDVVDYEHLSANEKLTLSIETAAGELIDADVEKDDYDPLGLQFESGLMSSVRQCKNKCIFCFIDQMPRGLRPTLSVKDDDWRMSFIMGNYITLTNVSEDEFDRILRRQAGPLYISVHATAPDVRVKMMRNPSAALINERLKRLADAGISINCQIVLCPNINDGDVLNNTVRDLRALGDAVSSIAVIPVGLTKYRDGLFPLRNFTEIEASAVIEQVKALDNGDGVVFTSDEFYVLAGRELPPYEAYGDFSQLENGVGLLRKFEREFIDALGDFPRLKNKVTLNGATGAAAYSFLKTLFLRLEEKNVYIDLHRIRNDFFGASVTVSGLITGDDLVKQLDGHINGVPLIIPHSMLREGENVFLDGISLDDVKERLRTDVWPLCPYDGGFFIEELFNAINEQEKQA